MVEAAGPVGALGTGGAPGLGAVGVVVPGWPVPGIAAVPCGVPGAAAPAGLSRVATMVLPVETTDCWTPATAGLAEPWAPPVPAWVAACPAPPRPCTTGWPLSAVICTWGLGP